MKSENLTKRQLLLVLKDNIKIYSPILYFFISSIVSFLLWKSFFKAVLILITIKKENEPVDIGNLEFITSSFSMLLLFAILFTSIAIFFFFKIFKWPCDKRLYVKSRNIKY
ncbi:hypothetical protein CMT75_18605 [Elizabethkingia anophelis]|nr:hypothetical protein [Elizabethkingia anophelis]